MAFAPRNPALGKLPGQMPCHWLLCSFPDDLLPRQALKVTLPSTELGQEDSAGRWTLRQESPEGLQTNHVFFKVRKGHFPTNLSYHDGAA